MYKGKMYIEKASSPQCEMCHLQFEILLLCLKHRACFSDRMW